MSMTVLVLVACCSCNTSSHHTTTQQCSAVLVSAFSTLPSSPRTDDL